MIFEYPVPLLSELEGKLKTLLHFFSSFFLLYLSMNLFTQLVIVVCNPIMEG